MDATEMSGAGAAAGDKGDGEAADKKPESDA